MCVCVCMCVRVCACVSVCVCMCGQRLQGCVTKHVLIRGGRLGAGSFCGCHGDDDGEDEEEVDDDDDDNQSLPSRNVWAECVFVALASLRCDDVSGGVADKF